MSDVEKELLNNVLDGLDRLFDRESTVIDLFALIFATSKALDDTEHFHILDNAAKNLEKIKRLNLLAEDERDEALKMTLDLRFYLAKFWKT